uniref:Uncharacterized mitochondrial protein AtMg00810-like n=1 Tax=Tanacetum cinerariifolium TaxID=118510 RepID=A0A6L2NQ51_TANCI|nr:uncharacterized mitochondrial protein AtMg00810-like [Tanacetum cinerariifolium]
MSVPVETSTSIALGLCDGLGGYDWSDQAEEGPNYALMAFSSLSSNSEILKSVEKRLEVYKTNESIYLKDIKVLKVEIQMGEIAIRELRKKLEIAQKEKDDIQLNVDKFKQASKSLNKLIECQIVDNCKKGLGYENYNAVPPPYTGNFMPLTPDLSFTGLDEFVNKPVVENCKAKSNEEETKVVKKNDDAPIIEEWVLDKEEEDVSQLKIKKKTVWPSIAKIEFVKPRQLEKTARKTIKQVEQHRQNTHSRREAVNAACYVQNKVLVVKPHNKTPYELFHGRTPTLSFIRPFGCLVTILNTIDHLGKFDGKADEGFFVGYSLNSKAFRVFTSRTRKVEENLHIRFSKSTPNVVGIQSNGFVGTKASDNADPKNSNDDGSKPSSDNGKKVDEDPRKKNECNDQEKEDNVNNTNNVNFVSSTINTAGINKDNELLFDPNMPALEDVSMYNLSRDNKDDGNIEEEVYVCQPPGFKDPDFIDRVYKVKKTLYGLHQAPRAWYKTLSTYLLDTRFQRWKINKALFIKRHNGDILLVQVYVDDIIFGSRKKELYNAFEKLMHEKFQMSSMGELTFFLGLQCLSLKTTAWNEFSITMASTIICLATDQKFNISKLILDNMIRNLDSVSDEAAHKELGDSLVRAATTASSLETEEHNGNINKTQSKVTPNESSSQGTDSGGGPRCQETMGDTTTQTRFESISKHSNDSLLVGDEEEVAIDAIPLDVKSPRIVDWKIHKKGKKSYYQILRADGKSQMYMFFSQMLKSFDKEDLEDLYKLVKSRYKSIRPVKNIDYLLWSDMKLMFEPHVKDEVWKMQQGYKVLEWKLYDSCGVHSLRMQSRQIYMLVEKMLPSLRYSRSLLKMNSTRIIIDQCNYISFGEFTDLGTVHSKGRELDGSAHQVIKGTGISGEIVVAGASVTISGTGVRTVGSGITKTGLMSKDEAWIFGTSC